MVWGGAANKSQIQGANQNLVIRSDAATTDGSIQLESSQGILVNNALRVKEDGGYTRFETGNTNISFARGGLTSPTLELRPSSIHLLADVIASNTISATGNISTSGIIGIETTNATDHINITDYTGISAGTLVTTAATEAFDTLNATNVRGAKYLVHASYGGDVSTSEIIVTHNGTDAFVTMFGDVHTNPGNAVATFTVELTGGNLEVRATSTVGTFIQFTRFTMNV